MESASFWRGCIEKKKDTEIYQVLIYIANPVDT